MLFRMKRPPIAGLLVLSFVAAGAQSANPHTGQGVGIDPALLSRANGGDAAAQVQVGECYADGKGVPRDTRQAADWYSKAASQKDVEGELHLAELYRDGDGKKFPRDMEQAAAWYRKAADQGDAAAQGTMGMLYMLGQGVPQSYMEAYFWLDLAASVKSPLQAQYLANRQNVGEHITADDLSGIQDREAQWKASHPQPGSR